MNIGDGRIQRNWNMLLTRALCWRNVSHYSKEQITLFSRRLPLCGLFGEKIKYFGFSDEINLCMNKFVFFKLYLNILNKSSCWMLKLTLGHKYNLFFFHLRRSKCKISPCVWITTLNKSIHDPPHLGILFTWTRSIKRLRYVEKQPVH